MPAFVTNGPDIPERLLQAHEEGRVVFFCGAGISYPAGLPSFSGLVRRIYEELSITPSRVQQAAIEERHYDTAIGLLEANIVGGRETVRRALVRILTPGSLAPSATATHQALLTLARNRNGQLRLITTNFDRLFEVVIDKNKLPFKRFEAPLLPVPKSRWDGLVYLHGLLSPAPTTNDLDHLVLSSGDFGLAYLTERWAARFVSELFRNYKVCFVGYSINDAVLRYMMDALAADRLLGESPPEMFALGSYSKGKERVAADEWLSKNVTPLLYREHNRHAYMHRTLRAWAKTYRDGVRGKQMIIAQHATIPPLAPSRSDFAVGRMLWALTDGMAAQHFADLNPVPPLGWLEPLSEAQFGYKDLSRYGVTPNSERDDKLSFSVMQRPTPYTRAPRMCIADWGKRESSWDGVMLQLARWLIRHLDDPKLILWLVKQGGHLNENLKWLIRHRLDELYQLHQKGEKEEIKRITEAAPKAIPRPSMCTLWRLFLSGRMRSRADDIGLHFWTERLKREGFTPILRMQLREILAPLVTLREPFRWPEEAGESREPERIKDLVAWEIVLSSDNVHSALRELKGSIVWQSVLPDLLQDFSMLLRDALDLMRELGGATDTSDLSYSDQPSIGEHQQNKDFQDWTALIDLTRDAWLAMYRTNPTKAVYFAEDWSHVPYPLFKRIAFFAAASSDVIPPRQALEWLLKDNHWWLWSSETQRETIRLLVALAPKLNKRAFSVMKRAILDGPPREMFRGDLELDEWKRIVDHEVWLRLAKIKATGARLGQIAQTKLDELCREYPKWQIAPNEQDEFPVWMGEGFEFRKFTKSPSRRRDLMDWLLKQPKAEPFWEEDDWSQRCHDDFPTTACALCGLAQRGEWPAERWRDALQAWDKDNKLLRPSWRYMAKVLDKAPMDKMRILAHSLSGWLRDQAKVFEGQDELFFSLIRRILALEYEEIETDDPVFRAINHAVGLATEALLRWWFRQKPENSQGLDDAVKPLFTQLCDAGIRKFRPGRVWLATHVIALFQVDENWTKEHLLPFFDWQKSEIEAQAAWEGFLWSPRLYPPFLATIKEQLSETAKRYGQIGKHASQYATFLAFIALDRGDIFTIKELTDATESLPPEGLRITAQAIARAIESAGEQRSEYWRNRVLPYIRSIWPKTLEVRLPELSEPLGRVCLAAGDSFPEAFGALRHWLQPVGFPHSLVQLLNQAKLPQQFPLDALAFLDAIIADSAHLLPEELKQSLDAIATAESTLKDDPRFIRLSKLSGP